MEKIDFNKDLSHLYRPSTNKIATIDVPELNFIMIDGMGNPNTEKSYVHAIICQVSR